VSTESTRLKGIRGDTFGVDLEYTEELVFIHFSDIEKFNVSVFRQMRSLLKDWWVFFKIQGYKAIFAHLPNDHQQPKNIRLLTKLGFKPHIKTADSLVFIYR
jgi:hypothetical protein